MDLETAPRTDNSKPFTPTPPVHSTSSNGRGGGKQRKGKRLLDTTQDGSGSPSSEGHRHRKKSKTFDASQSKLVQRPSATSSSNRGPEVEKKRKPEAQLEGSSSYSKLQRVEMKTKTDENGEVENAGSGEVASSDEYRDPLLAFAPTEDESEDSDQWSYNEDESDSNSEGNWRNDYPDDEEGDDGSNSSSSSGGEEDGDYESFRSFNRKVTDEDIAACSSKLGKMLKDFHKQNNAPLQVSPETRRRHATGENALEDDDDEEEDFEAYCEGSRGSRFLDGGLADEVVSSATESE